MRINFLLLGVENNYSIEIDTISLEEVQRIEFYSPKELSKEGNRIIESMKKESSKLFLCINELF